jgi:hypothetical protein
VSLYSLAAPDLALVMDPSTTVDQLADFDRCGEGMAFTIKRE